MLDACGDRMCNAFEFKFKCRVAMVTQIHYSKHRPLLERFSSSHDRVLIENNRRWRTAIVGRR